MTRPERVAVREAQARTRADEWALVLASADIGCTVSTTSGAWCVTVDAEDVERARRALDAYDREQPAPARKEAPLPDWGPTRAGIAVGLLLLVFHAAVADHADWYRLGGAAGARILAGEWWRTVTALTLHANLAHVTGNAVAAAVFLTAVCRLVGPGAGLCLALLAGTGANAINATIRPLTQSSIGASTAVFACLGILSGYQFLRRRRMNRTRGRDWLPLAAGLALLGWLGGGPESDVVGHLLGFLIGAVVGVVLALHDREPLSRRVQDGLVVAAVLTVISCWLLAFRLGSP
jgi:membrane associated rhomboid family serine protease